ncbi:tagaturonate reductase [Psychromonas sp. SA13A]|uniref:tagaturonate reductase n=1 Tax=Psychromonas sp. SA13A TaxID=2686346 RepID=UPI00140C3425|nr:tagaturonate reductase [Psychromonas sp. SA13A]
MTDLLKRDLSGMKSYPEKIIQFGGGNFLRAFIGWQVQLLNEQTDFNAGITIVRSIDAGHQRLDSQDGLYTAIVRGINESGKSVSQPKVISSINRELFAYGEFEEVLKIAENPELEWVVSNTTEAGIEFKDSDKITDFPPATFPAKLTLFLLRRFETFNGDKNKGLILLPCELIDYNGEKLKETIKQYADLWNLSDEFKGWLNESNTFCSTLVDRIVTGYPKDEIKQLEAELGYKDNFIVAAEYFYLFVIQGPCSLKDKLKLAQCSLNIKVVDDIKPYKQRKVGILNGAHTAMVPVAYLAGLDTVGESMADKDIVKFVANMLDDEIIPMLSMDKTELTDFRNSVMQRFENPYIKHYLLSISLNSLTKFTTRLLPQLISYVKEMEKAPKNISFSLAALFCFYLGQRNNEDIPLNDDQILLDKFEIWKKSDIDNAVSQFLSMKDHWGVDLTSLQNLEPLVKEYVNKIQTVGMRQAIKSL